MKRAACENGGKQQEEGSKSFVPLAYSALYVTIRHL
jgi:hypothetical protein